MTKSHMLAVAVLCASPMLSAQADTFAILSTNNQIGIQYTSTKVDYTETGSGLLGTPTGTLDTENGTISGYAVNLSTMQDWWLGNDYLSLNYSHSNGDTSYVGQPIAGTTNAYGSLSGSDGATLEDLSLRWGKGFSLSQNSMLTPYFELGYHSWDRGVNAGETYRNRYYGLGALAQYAPTHNLTLTANGLVGGTFGANITVAPDGGYSGFSGSLGTSTLWRIGGSVDYAFTTHLHGNLGVDYTSFKYGASSLFDVGGGYVAWEPDSTTHYTVARVGLGYSF